MKTLEQNTDGINLRAWRVALLKALLVIITASTSQAQTSESAINYFNRASRSQVKGNLNAAIADYDAAIAFNPGWALAYVGRGTARSESRPTQLT